MRKREEEALRQLEAALLESEEAAAPEETEFPEARWDACTGTAYANTFGSESGEVNDGSGYTAYNADSADVDLDEYSEEVLRGSRRSAMPFFLTALTLLLLCAAILLLLKMLGVL